MRADFPRADHLEARAGMLEATAFSKKTRSSRRKSQIFREILDEENKRS